MALGIKTIDTIRKQLPTKSLYTLFQSIVLSHLDYSALFLSGVNNSLIVSLEKQMNWGLKRTFFRSSYKSSTLLRQSKKILGISQTIDLKSLLYFYNYIKGEKLAFQENLKLPNALFHINSRTKKVIFQDHISSAFLHKSFFRSTSMKWNSLPSQIRKFSLTKQKLKSELKLYLFKNTNHLDLVAQNTWKDFHFI